MKKCSMRSRAVSVMLACAVVGHASDAAAGWCTSNLSYGGYSQSVCNQSGNGCSVGACCETTLAVGGDNRCRMIMLTPQPPSTKPQRVTFEAIRPTTPEDHSINQLDGKKM